MLWTVLLGLALNNKVIYPAYGYYQESPADTSNNDPYTRVYYSSSPYLNSNYVHSGDQYSGSSANSLPYSLAQQEQDQSQSLRLPTYGNSYEEPPSYPPSEEYPSYPPADESNYQPVSYEPAPPQTLSSAPGSHDTSKYEVSPTSPELHSAPNTYHHAPQTTIHLNSEPVPLSQHIQITRNIPVPIIRPIHIPVAKPVRVEIPHPIIVPVLKPYQIRVPVAQPIAVPTVREITLPVEKVVPFPVEKRIPYTVEKHVPYKVEKHVIVHVPQSYPIKVPIFKTIVHRVKSYGRFNLHGVGWN